MNKKKRGEKLHVLSNKIFVDVFFFFSAYFLCSTIQCCLLSWYHDTASSTHSTACLYSSAISPITSHTCPWTPPFQSLSNNPTVGEATAVEVVALFPFLQTLHIHLLQPAVVLTQTLLQAQGPPVHSSSQVHQILMYLTLWNIRKDVCVCVCLCERNINIPVLGTLSWILIWGTNILLKILNSFYGAVTKSNNCVNLNQATHLNENKENAS